MSESLKNHLRKDVSRGKRPSNLEIADQMFKDAFLIKKTRFSHLHPELTDEELHKMTAAYFKKLNEETTS